MSITSRINEMSSHIEQAYDELQGLGADLTNVNKNIENISMVLDDIYDSLPSVSGEGTNLTLDDTRVGKIKSTLKGNTSQTTYSGKNLLPNNATSGTRNGITWVVNNDGTILINGTATAKVNISTSNYYFPIDGAYILSGCPSGGNSNTYSLVIGYYDENKHWKAEAYDTGSGKALNQSYAYANVGILIRSGTTCNNLLFKPQLEAGSQVTSYEPYVGGTASPNPSYPQPVNVVSGDNEISVCGKNLLPNVWVSGSISGSTGNPVAYGSRIYTTNKIKVQPSTTYTIHNHNTSTYTISNIIDGYTKDGTYIARIGSYTNGANFTTQSTCEYINITLNNPSDTMSWNIYQEYLGNGTIQPQLEKGNQATIYEPYQGNTYNIDLPVENLFDSSLFTNGTTHGITLTKNNDGTITLNGTSTARVDFTIIDLFSLKGDNKISSISKKSGTTTGNVTFGIYDSNWTNGKQCNITSSSGMGSVVLSSEITYTKCFIRIESGITLSNLTIALQIEKGSKQNSFTPYGTTPIELCKIGNYQDYIYKDSDKWYLHKEIGKVVLNGSEDIGRTEATNSTFRFTVGISSTNIIKMEDANTTSIILSDKFVAGSRTLTYMGTQCICYGMESTTSYKDFIIYCEETKNMTIAEFITWLSNNNVTVYYVLLTPTTTEITYQPLIDQLNLLEQAQSKENQTNISQVNNDLPFIISASALKEWSV